MLFIARFKDRANSQHIRRQHQDSQETYVIGNRQAILANGPLFQDDLGNAIGGLWFIEAKDRREAERICHESPFWLAGLWNSVTLMPQLAPINSYANVRVTCL